MPEWDPSMETPTIDLIGYKTTREDIFTLYQEVYWLKRAPGMVPCDPETEEEIYQEILDLLQECLWHRQGSTPPCQRKSLGEVSPVPGPIG